MNEKQLTAVSKIAGLTVLNALVFQEVLSGEDARVEPLRRSLDAEDMIGRLSEHWRMILDEIDYVPIFRVARDLLITLPANEDIEQAVRYMAERALNIVRRRAALRHDLMGRVYHPPSRGCEVPRDLLHVRASRDDAPQAFT